MDRSTASKRPTQPHGFISDGILVFSDHAAPTAGDVDGASVVGLFAGVTGGLLGSVLSVKLPKCASWAENFPVIVESVKKSLQSPRPSMWMSTVGAVLSSWMTCVTLPATPLISSLTSHRSSASPFVSHCPRTLFTFWLKGT